MAHWADEGYPPIEEGLGEKEGRAAAKLFMDAYFDKKWNRRKEERLYGRTLSEITRLSQLVPVWVDEVYEERREQDEGGS